MKNLKKLIIYEIFNDKYYYKFDNEIIIKIQAGSNRITKEFDFFYLRDNQFNNISSKNENFSELTAVYSIYKNYLKNSEYIGFYHYRRFLVCDTVFLLYLYKIIKFISNNIFRKIVKNRINNSVTKLNKNCELYDIILPKKIKIPMTLKEHYAKYHYIEHLEKLLDILREDYPEIYKYSEEVLEMKNGYFFNIFLMKRYLFKEYSNILFDILFKLEKKIDIPEDRYQKRVFGFIAERFFNIFIVYKKSNYNLKYKEYNFIYI